MILVPLYFLGINQSKFRSAVIQSPFIPPLCFYVYLPVNEKSSWVGWVCEHIQESKDQEWDNVLNIILMSTANSFYIFSYSCLKIKTKSYFHGRLPFFWKSHSVEIPVRTLLLLIVFFKHTLFQKLWFYIYKHLISLKFLLGK